MNYKFKGEIFKEGTKSFIKIPFNVWEVCDKKGNIPVKVTICNYTFECKLIPKGNGNYYIPITKSNLQNIEIDMELDITFEIIDALSRINKNSPYSLKSPIRKINDIELVLQPKDGLCIQACVAMLSGVSIYEVIDLMGSKKWQASLSKMIEALDYYGIAHSDKMVYSINKDTAIPKCCVINTQGHLMIFYDGKYYDPVRGVLEKFDLGKITGYLEIIL